MGVKKERGKSREVGTSSVCVCVCVCVREREIVRDREQSDISGHRGSDREWQKLTRWREVGRCLPGKEGLGFPANIFVLCPLGVMDFNTMIILSLLKRTSLVAQMVKCLPTMQEARVQSPGGEDPLEEEMATHSSTLAWKILWEEPGRLQSMGSQRIRHD